MWASVFHGASKRFGKITDYKTGSLAGDCELLSDDPPARTGSARKAARRTTGKRNPGRRFRSAVLLDSASYREGKIAVKSLRAFGFGTPNNLRVLGLKFLRGVDHGNFWKCFHIFVVGSRLNARPCHGRGLNRSYQRFRALDEGVQTLEFILFFIIDVIGNGVTPVRVFQRH